MITIEEKLNVFSKLVFEGERKKALDELHKIERQNEEIEAKLLEDIKSKGEEIIQKKIEEANKLRREIIAKAHMDVRKKLLATKREFLSRVEREIQHKAVEFTRTKEYKRFFFNSLSNILLNINDVEEISIYITKTDMNNFKDRIMDRLNSIKPQNNKISLEVLEENKIGGVMLINHSKGVRIDLTIKAILDENKNLMGQMVYTSLEE